MKILIVSAGALLISSIGQAVSAANGAVFNGWTIVMFASLGAGLTALFRVESEWENEK